MRHGPDPLDFFLLLVGVALISIALASLVGGVLQGCAVRRSQEACRARGGLVTRVVGGDWYCVDSRSFRGQLGGVP